MQYQNAFAGFFGASCPNPSFYEQGRGCCISAELSGTGKKHCCAVSRTSVVKRPKGKFHLKCFDDANPQDRGGGGSDGVGRVKSRGRGTEISTGGDEEEGLIEGGTGSVILYAGLAVVGVWAFKKFSKKKKQQ